MVPSAFCFAGPESTWNLICDILRLPHHCMLLTEHLQGDSCSSRGYQAPTRKTMPVVKTPLPWFHALSPAVAAEFQWRTVSSVSTGCSVLLLTCLVRGDEGLPSSKNRRAYSGSCSIC